MSTSAPQTASVLDDYLDLFDALSELGVEFVVIGGYAVAAYARLLGESVFSQDLDLFVTRRTLEAVVGESAALGVTVEQLPSPREVPVAVLKWRGLEVNLLTASEGLPTPDVEADDPRRRPFRPAPQQAGHQSSQGPTARYTVAELFGG